MAELQPPSCGRHFVRTSQRCLIGRLIRQSAARPGPAHHPLGSPQSKIRARRGPTRLRISPLPSLPQVSKGPTVYHAQTKNLLITLRRSTFSDRTQAALPTGSDDIGTLWNLHKAAVRVTPSHRNARLDRRPGQHQSRHHRTCKRLRKRRSWKKSSSPQPDGASAKSASGQQESWHSHPQTATLWNRQPHQPEPASCSDALRQAGGRQ